MPWVKLDDSFATHPKVLQAGPVAAWLYVAGLCYCARYLTDGFISDACLPHIGAVCDESALEALIASGLWEAVEGGYRVHDYLDFNPSRSQIEGERAAAKERMANKRGSSGNVPANNGRTTGEQSANFGRSSSSPSESRPNPESRPEEKTPPSYSSPPSWWPEYWDSFQAAYPKRSGGQRWEEARTKLLRFVTKGGVDPEVIMSGVCSYREWCEATGKVGTELVKQAASWVSGKMWQEEYVIPPERAGPNGKPERTIEERAAEYRAVLGGET